MFPSFEHLLTPAVDALLQIGSVIATLAIILGLIYNKQKQFNTTDPAPELLKFLPKKSPISPSTVEVAVGLFIKNFNQFDFILNQFVIEATVWFEFNPSLIDTNVIGKFSFEKGKLQHLSDPEIKLEKNLLLVKYNVQITLSTNADHRLFPFNDHCLYLVLQNEFVSPSDVVFKIYESYFGWSDKIHTVDWRIVGKTVETGYSEASLDYSDPKKNLVHPRVVFTLKLARAGIRKTLLVILPVFLVLFSGMIALSLDPNKLPSTLFSLSVGSITGLLAYRFVLERISPSVGYFTAMDYLYFLILGCSFVTFILTFLLINAVDYRNLILIAAKTVFFITQFVLIFFTFYLLNDWRRTNKSIIFGAKKHSKFSKLKLSLNLSLQELNRYAKLLEEFPQSENDNLLNPEYTFFHSKLVPTPTRHFFNKVSNLFRRKKKFWLPDIFQQLLLKTIRRRDVLKSLDNYIIKLTTKKKSRFVIWGDLQGAFHSLVRDLNELQRAKIIDDNLRIIKPKTYFVFNGDVIDRSPYIMETLVVVMYLILKNPYHSIYIRGNHEHKELWHNYQLAKELAVRACHLDKQPIPFNDQLKSLFNALPVALYLKVGETGVVRLSHFSSAELNFNERSFAEFISNDRPGELREIKLTRSDRLVENFKIDAIIRGIERTVGYRQIQALELMVPEKGATTWSMLSAPTSCYQELYHFYFDSFAILQIENRIDDCVLYSYQRDVRGSSNFSISELSLIYGIKLTNREILATLRDGKKISLGTTLDLSKTSSILGKHLLSGLRLGINDINETTGINKHLLRHIVLDDQYTPYLTTKCVERLQKLYQTDILFSPLGTPTVEAILPEVRDKQLLVLFPYSGANIFRKPELECFIHLRTSYYNEAKSLINFAISYLGLKRFAIFYQDDSYGRSALEGALSVLKVQKKVDWLEISYQRNMPNVDEAAKKTNEFNPATILFFSTSTQAIALVHKLGINYLIGKSLMGISFVTDVFRDFLHTCGLELTISRVLPDVASMSIEIVQDYYQSLQHNHKRSFSSQDSLEGYVNTMVLQEILNRIEPPFTKEKIIKEAEAIKNENFKGIDLHFNPQTRELCHTVWIDNGNGLWVEYNYKD